MFAEHFHAEMNITVLVDFENDSTKTALEVAEALGDRLWGVRLDTGEDMVDRSLIDEMGGFRPTGVNPRLVEKVRDGLDEAGHEGVRIVASGGFTAAADPGVRGRGRTGRRLRRRLLADPGRERLHRRRRAAGWTTVREGGPAVLAESPP